MGWQPSAPAGTASPRKSQSPAAPAAHARPRQRSASPAASPLRTAERPARSASNAPPPAKKACVAASARVGTLSQNGYGTCSASLTHIPPSCQEHRPQKGWRPASWGLCCYGYVFVTAVQLGETNTTSAHTHSRAFS